MKKRLLVFLNPAVALSILVLPSYASAGSIADMFRFSGYLQSDIRFNIDAYRGPVAGQGYNFSKNQNDVDMRVEFQPFSKMLAVAEPHIRFFGFSQAYDLNTLSVRENVDPFDVRLEEAYIMLKGLISDKVDLKIGRMITNWGSIDIFSPTDNINAHDFSDPLDWAAKIPNQMVELDIYPTDWLQLTAIWIPVFKPSQLPDSAVLGFAPTYNQNGCVASFPAPPVTADTAWKLYNMFGAVGDPCRLNLYPTVNLKMPANTIGDSQAAAKARFKAGDLDISLSYYYGRFTFPVALDAYVEVANNQQTGKFDVAYQAEVYFPRMQVIGLDFSYSIPWLFNVGLMGDFTLVIPEPVTFGLAVPAVQLYTNNVNVPSTPYIKAAVGLDYTFTKWLYANAMYLHGFFDEFNDMFGLHNYAMLALQMKFFNDELQLMLSGLLDCNDLSSVFYWQATWVVVPSVEIIVGTLIFGGDINASNDNPYPPRMDYAAKYKFGQRAAGRDVAFLRTKFTW